MNKQSIRIFFVIFVCNLLASPLFAEDGVIVHQVGNVAYVFPWRMCLIISAAVSAGIYFLRGSR